MVTFVAEVAGTVDEFNQAAFKQNLATLLEGVSPSDIEVSVAAASVVVTSRIVAPSQEVATSALTALEQTAAGSPEAISRALGVTVVSVQAPTQELMVLSSPPAIPSGLGEDAGLASGRLGIFGVSAIVLGAIGSAAICCGLLCWLRWSAMKPNPRHDVSATYFSSATGPMQPVRGSQEKAFGAIVSDGKGSAGSLAMQSYYRVPLPPEPALPQAPPNKIHSRHSGNI